MLFVRPDWPRGPASLLFNTHQIFLGIKQREVVLTVHPNLKPTCEWVEAVPPPPLCARIGMSRGDLHCNKYSFVNYLFK